MSDEFVEVDVFIVEETDKAILVENMSDEEVWIPKSRIKDGIDERDINVEVDRTIDIPEWLALREGLI